MQPKIEGTQNLNFWWHLTKREQIMESSGWELHKGKYEASTD